MTLSVSQVDFFVMFIRYRKMTEEKKEACRIMVLNDVIIELPASIETKINPVTGNGEVTLFYISNPEECYKTHKEITSKWKDHSSSCFKFV